MVSRVTLLEIDTLRVPADEAVALFRERVLPGLHDLDGFEGVLVLVNPDGKGMTISMWRDAAAAEASAGFAAGAVDEFVTLYRARVAAYEDIPFPASAVADRVTRCFPERSAARPRSRWPPPPSCPGRP